MAMVPAFDQPFPSRARLPPSSLLPVTLIVAPASFVQIPLGTMLPPSLAPMELRTRLPSFTACEFAPGSLVQRSRS